MDLCSRREYCITDISEKLYKWEIDKPNSDKIIEQLIAEKYLDHSRYCRAFVNDKFKFNHWGRIKITYHLKHKMIEDSFIKSAIDQVDEETYHKVILEEIKKKSKTVKGKTNFEKQGRIAKAIISKGFEPSLVCNLLKKE